MFWYSAPIGRRLGGHLCTCHVGLSYLNRVFLGLSFDARSLAGVQVHELAWAQHAGDSSMHGICMARASPLDNSSERSEPAG